MSLGAEVSTLREGDYRLQTKNQGKNSLLGITSNRSALVDLLPVARFFSF